jgi:hypothetical protein
MIPKVKSTFSVVLDTYLMSFSVVLGVTKDVAMKEHKKWFAKIKKQEWIKLPAEVPVQLRTEAVLALRVVEVTAEEQRLHNLANNPAVNQVIDGSNRTAARIVSENTDMGYK